MNNGMEYKLIKTHIRSIDTLIKKIPERHKDSYSERQQLRKLLIDLESKLNDFRYWNEKKYFPYWNEKK